MADTDGSSPLGKGQKPLIGRATTAISRTEIHTQTKSNTEASLAGSKGRYGSRQTSTSSIGRLISQNRSEEIDDSASIRSFAPTLQTSEDVESLLGGPLADFNESHWSHSNFKDTDTELASQGDQQFVSQFNSEFVELGDLQANGSNEEALVLAWSLKLKHFLILSSAGKPIYSRHGDDQLISNAIGVIQTIISFYQSSEDVLRSFDAGDAHFTILSKGHLHLVAVSRLEENDLQLRTQLEALYMQILSTLTLPRMQKMFLDRPSADLRRPLEGTEKLLSALSDGFTRGSPSTLLSALECLKLRKTHRQIINNTFLNLKSPGLLYGLIVAGGRLVSVLRPKKHSLHPGDLQLIFNMLFEAVGVRNSSDESYIPLCLPGFNNAGYIFMYVSFLPTERDYNHGEDNTSDGIGSRDDVTILLISANKESFYELKKMREDLVEQLESNGSMNLIRLAVRKGRQSCTDIVAGTTIHHFLYKSRANVQFTMPSSHPAYDTPLKWRRLMCLYSSLHANVHNKGSQLKMYHCTSRDHVALALVTPSYELYCVATPTSNRNTLALGASKIIQWARREQERLFVIGGAVF